MLKPKPCHDGIDDHGVCVIVPSSLIMSRMRYEFCHGLKRRVIAPRDNRRYERGTVGDESSADGWDNSVVLFAKAHWREVGSQLFGNI